MDVYRVSDAEPESTATSSPSTSGEAALREPPLSLFGEITSPGFRALRMVGTTLATASETRIDVFGRSLTSVKTQADSLCRCSYIAVGTPYRDSAETDRDDHGMWPMYSIASS
jgi:hypothetical protein